MKTEPSEAAALCAAALVICREWFGAAYPDAAMRVEVEPGTWEVIGLMDACEKSLEAFREEHGKDE